MPRKPIVGLFVSGMAALFAVPLASAAQTPEATDPPPVLTELTGTLAKAGEEYLVDGTAADFGAAWYIAAAADFDGDGTTGTIAAELDGLVGTSVTLQAEQGRCGDYDVYTINGIAYRDVAGDRPPWAGGPQRVGPIHPGYAAAVGGAAAATPATSGDLTVGPPGAIPDANRAEKAERSGCPHASLAAPPPAA